MAVTPNSIVTPQTINVSTGVVTTANTTYGDSPTNTVQIFSAGPDGARITRMTCVPRATCTATLIDIFRDNDGSGTVRRLIQRRLQAAQTIDTTTVCPTTDFGYTEAAPLILRANEKLYASMTVALAGGIVVNVEGSNY
jgi:hypothetical protein